MKKLSLYLIFIKAILQTEKNKVIYALKEHSGKPKIFIVQQRLINSIIIGLVINNYHKISH